MTEISIIISIVAALGLGAMSPGPSFLLVARTAAAHSRSQGVAAALGMGTGGMFFALIALTGLHLLITNVPTIYLAIRIMGACYLMYLGYKIVQSSKQPLLDGVGSVLAVQPNNLTAFGVGLATQLSNPKTAVVYASVFTSLLPAAFSIGFGILLVTLVFVIEAGWYILVALVLSSTHLRQQYLRRKVFVDILAGIVMIALGVKLILNLI